MRAVYALYDTERAARRAVEGLRASGVAAADITVLSGRPLTGDMNVGRTQRGVNLWFAAGVGGLLGFAAGVWLTSATQTSWPLQTGNMPIVTWWSNLVIMFELTMLGLILATVASFLVTAGLPDRSDLYDPAVTDGKILVGVEGAHESTVLGLQRALSAAGSSVKTI